MVAGMYLPEHLSYFPLLLTYVAGLRVYLFQTRASLRDILSGRKYAADQSESRKWHSPVSYSGFRTRSFYNHKIRHIACLIYCSLLNFDLSVIPEGEILA